MKIINLKVEKKPYALILGKHLTLKNPKAKKY